MLLCPGAEEKGVLATGVDRRDGMSGNFTLKLEGSGLNLMPCGLQEAPIIMSEPHFLHGDPELLSYARGLKPDENRHSTFIVIEPVTGAPLSGEKKIQLNLRLSRQPVELLSNVSEGFFPLMWCENVSFLREIIVKFQALNLKIRF